MSAVRKIINDPVYGFITIDHPLILDIISHPVYQRLRNIHQMAFAHLVYPGAVHSRLHHSLGAYHLMCIALTELKSKGVVITTEEELGAKIAILLHDLGHGPFSHALEQELIKDVHHEEISLLLMQQLNLEFGGQLDTAIAIFTGKYEKQFLHQLVSGQLDVDRMDYLNRDSFFTGVAEGVIGYDRILKMLAVKNGQLMVEEKAIYSIEKFLITPSPFLNIFLEKGEKMQAGVQQWLFEFCQLDDHDLMGAIKYWQLHEDRVLSGLCRALVERKLLKVKLQAAPFDLADVQEKRKAVATAMGIRDEEADYFVFTGEASNTTYDPGDERINILFKDGSIRDISEVDNALVQHNLKDTVKKYYICYQRI